MSALLKSPRDFASLWQRRFTPPGYEQGEWAVVNYFGPQHPLGFWPAEHRWDPLDHHAPLPTGKIFVRSPWPEFSARELVWVANHLWLEDSRATPYVAGRLHHLHCVPYGLFRLLEASPEEREALIALALLEKQARALEDYP